ncbi:uncharacterized protein LOC111033721 [Myzus persicae]|uniref:uncharacterized protein LOC111033721 n=1 Tax=Myzus persicae TaxID=13164 RepID=UPI000B9355A9|nr:uncharacterized protein LOC111033721 [Myzus persicae]
MDIRNENNHVFNIGLAKLSGLYQMLDPGTVKFRGQNVYQIFVGFFVLFSFVGAMTLIAGSLYYWTDNTSVTIWYFWSTTNSLYACYKMCTVFYRSNDIWNCLSITRYGFTSLSSRKRNGHDILDRWRARSVWYTSLLSGAYCWSLVFYAGCLLAFGDATIPIKNHDGSIGNYRPNVLNLYFIASDETYNEYYNTFFVVETLFVASITIIYLLFDVLLLTLCLAICCQMQIICSAFESVNRKSLSDSHSNAVGKYEFTSIIVCLILVLHFTFVQGTNFGQIVFYD